MTRSLWRRPASRCASVSLLIEGEFRSSHRMNCNAVRDRAKGEGSRRWVEPQVSEGQRRLSKALG